MPKLTMPTLFFTHGGGPMPLLGQQPALAASIQAVTTTLLRPKAILIISAHWEEDRPTLTTSSKPAMLYDYGGFSKAAYQLKYPAPGSPELAAHVASLLSEAGFKTAEDSERGFDHGVFVPLMLLYPDADIPVVCLSLLSSLDPGDHLRMGAALAPLRSEGVLIVGSGSTFHNMRAFMTARRQFTGITADGGDPRAQEFDRWVQRVITSANVSASERKQTLTTWESAPSARHSQPREEHLLPLHVVAAAADYVPGHLIGNDASDGFAVSSFRFD